MRTTVLLALTCLSLLLPAQQKYNNDAQVRSHFSLEKKLGKKFTVHLDQQYRFTNNVSDYTRGSAKLGLTYKLTKNFRLLANYTYIQRQSNSGFWRQRNWYSGALVFKKNYGHWRVVGRVLLQARGRNVNSSQEHLYRLYNRNKISLRYEINKRLTGFIAQEIYIPLNNPQYRGIDRSRSITGILINTFKNQELELNFMFQHWFQSGGWWKNGDNFNDRLTKRNYSLGIGYGIAF